MRGLLTYARALYQMYQNFHWKSAGPQYYGDHQLYQRLYEGVLPEIDQLAERIMGTETHELDPVTDGAASAKMTEDLLQGLASKHEEHLYLLQQRAKTASRGSQNMLIELFKLAHTLDKKAEYALASEVDALIQELTQRAGLELKDITAAADYFDAQGDTDTANKLDALASNKKS